jgi:phosphatidate cytidylyltransferase
VKSLRIIVAAIVLPVLIAYLYYLPLFPFFLALLVCVAMISLREFFVMYGVRPYLSVPGIVSGGVLVYVSCIHPAYFFEVAFLSIFILLFLRILVSGSPSGAMSDIGPVGTGFLYIPGFLSFHWFLRTETLGLEYLFLLYCSVWTADSAAYYVGTYTGKNKLCPSISPNKTVEGAYGSVVGGAVGALIIKLVLHIPDISIIGVIIIGAVMGTSTIIGDLIESMFKRDAGVKDSSGLIPGHGGLLDKVDGLLVAGPVLYLIIRYVL